MERYKGFPIRKDMAAYRGDTFEKSLRIIARHPTTGDAYLLDTSGFTARFQVRETVDSVAVLTAALVTVGITGTSDNQSNLIIRIPSSVTANYPHGASWRYDLELTDPSGRRQTLMYGEFRVQGDVAK